MAVNSPQYGIVLVTVASLAQGETIAQVLLAEKLAACVNLLPVDSWYWWENKINRDREYQLLIKTKLSLFSQVREQIKTLHNYEVPEIIAIPIVAGSQSYLNWLDDNTIRHD